MAYLPTSFINADRPIHLALLASIFSGISLLVISKYAPTSKSSHSRTRSQYSRIPLYDLPNGKEKIEVDTHGTRTQALSSLALLGILLAAAVVLSLRIELQRHLLLASECSTRSVEVWLPFLVAVYDALRHQNQQYIRPSESHNQDEDSDEDYDQPDASAYEDLTNSLKSTFLSSKWRYLSSAFLLSLGCYLVAGLWRSSESTHICPLFSSDISMIPRFQLLALFFDLALAIAVFELTLGGVDSASQLLATPTSCAAVLTLTSSIWAIVVVIIYFQQPENRSWLLLQDGSASTHPLLILLGQALFLTMLCVSVVYSVCTYLSLSLLSTDIPCRLRMLAFCTQSQRLLPWQQSYLVFGSFGLQGVHIHQYRP